MNLLKLHLKVTGIVIAISVLCLLGLKIFQWSSESTLLYAAERGDVDTVKYLVEKGVPIQTMDGWSGTPMMYAAANGHTDIVAYLLDQGVNINARYRKNGTALMFAAINGQTDTVKFLLDKGADSSLRDEQGKTALNLAIEYKHPYTAELLRNYKHF